MKRRASQVLGMTTALAVAALAMSPSTARAQAPAPDAAGAEALFNEGRRLLDAGKAPEACPKLEESMRLDPGMGTQFFLAACYEATGRTASAWAAFREVESAARSAGRRDRQDLAKKRADALEPKLVRLQLEVPWADRVPGVEVRRGGVLVGRGSWGTPLPIDPGVVVLHVAAPQKIAADVRIELGEPGKTRVVTVPELADAPRAPAVAHDSRGPALESEPSSSPLRTAGWVTAGVGAAGVVTSAVLGLVAKSKFNDSKASCNANGDCTAASDVDGRRSAVSLASAGTVVFIGSLVVVVAGVSMILLAPKSAPATMARLTRLTCDGTSLGGRF